MIPGAQIVEVARTYVGTPFHQHGRIKGVGLDCVGLIVEVAREFGLDVDRPEWRDAGIRGTRDGVNLWEPFLEVADREYRPGRAVIMQMRTGHYHVGIMVPGGAVHADIARGVVEQSFGNWMQDLRGAVDIWRL